MELQLVEPRVKVACFNDKWMSYKIIDALQVKPRRASSLRA